MTTLENLRKVFQKAIKHPELDPALKPEVAIILLDALQEAKEGLEFYGDKKRWLPSTARGIASMPDSCLDKELLEPHEDYYGWFGGKRARATLSRIDAKLEELK
jgi:hypothetical protein